jgi:hypothetical protein
MIAVVIVDNVLVVYYTENGQTNIWGCLQGCVQELVNTITRQAQTKEISWHVASLAFSAIRRAGCM